MTVGYLPASNLAVVGIQTREEAACYALEAAMDRTIIQLGASGRKVVMGNDGRPQGPLAEPDILGLEHALAEAAMRSGDLSVLEYGGSLGLAGFRFAALPRISKVVIHEPNLVCHPERRSLGGASSCEVFTYSELAARLTAPRTLTDKISHTADLRCIPTASQDMVVRFAGDFGDLSPLPSGEDCVEIARILKPEGLLIMSVRQNQGSISSAEVVLPLPKGMTNPIVIPGNTDFLSLKPNRWALIVSAKERG